MRFVSSLVVLAAVAVTALSSDALAQSRRRGAGPNTPPPPPPAPAYQPAPPPPPVAPAYNQSPGFRAPEIREIDGRTHGGFKWDAFIDAAASAPSKTDFYGTPIKRGFYLNDAALFITKDFGVATALVELPFQSDFSGGSDSVNFGSTRAQAYVQINKWQPVMLRFGQYASFFGVEPNDSRDRLIANWGFIKQLILPKTHTGVQVGYQAQGFSLRGQLTNPADRNSMGADNPEYAALGRFDAGPGYGSVGLSLHDTRSTVAANKQNLLVNIMGGVKMEKMRLDGEVDIKKTAGSDKSTNAFGVFATVPLSPETAIGGRLEYLTDVVAPLVPAVASADRIFSFSAGPAYKPQPDLTLRGDFTLGSIKTANTDDTIYGLNLSLVAEL